MSTITEQRIFSPLNDQFCCRQKIPSSKNPKVSDIVKSCLKGPISEQEIIFTASKKNSFDNPTIERLCVESFGFKRTYEAGHKMDVITLATDVYKQIYKEIQSDNSGHTLEQNITRTTEVFKKVFEPFYDKKDSIVEVSGERYIIFKNRKISKVKEEISSDSYAAVHKLSKVIGKRSAAESVKIYTEGAGQAQKAEANTLRKLNPGGKFVGLQLPPHKVVSASGFVAYIFPSYEGSMKTADLRSDEAGSKAAVYQLASGCINLHKEGHYHARLDESNMLFNTSRARYHIAGLEEAQHRSKISEVLRGVVLNGTSQTPDPGCIEEAKASIRENYIPGVFSEKDNQILHQKLDSLFLCAKVFKNGSETQSNLATKEREIFDLMKAGDVTDLFTSFERMNLAPSVQDKLSPLLEKLDRLHNNSLKTSTSIDDFVEIRLQLLNKLANLFENAPV